MEATDQGEAEPEKQSSNAALASGDAQTPSSNRTRRPPLQVLIDHKPVVVAASFLLGDCISVILSHFEKRSRVYTLVIALLSLLLLSVCIVSFARGRSGRQDNESVSRFVKQMELVFSIVQCGIAWYDLVMVFQLHTIKDNTYYQLDWTAIVAFPLYVFFYTIYYKNNGAQGDSNSQPAAGSSPSVAAGSTTPDAEHQQQLQPTGCFTPSSPTSRESGNMSDDFVTVTSGESSMEFEEIIAEMPNNFENPGPGGPSP